LKVHKVHKVRKKIKTKKSNCFMYWQVFKIVWTWFFVNYELRIKNYVAPSKARERGI